MTAEDLYLNFVVSKPEVEMLDNYVGLDNINEINIHIYLIEVRKLIKDLQSIGLHGTVQDCMSILNTDVEDGVVRKAITALDTNV